MKYELPNIDQLIEMAKTNPEELERLRATHIEHVISSAPKHMQRRLRGLQFQIDGKRRIHSSPMGSCLMISKMMLDSVSQLHAALQGTIDKGNGIKGQVNIEKNPKASILPFPVAAPN